MSYFVLNVKKITKQTGQKALDSIASADAVCALLDELKAELLDDVVSAEEGGETERLKGAVQGISDVRAVIANLSDLVRNKR